MGLNDAEEMLEACKADNAQLEHDLVLAHSYMDAERHHRLCAERALAEIRDVLDEPAVRDEHSSAIQALNAIAAIVGDNPDD